MIRAFRVFLPSALDGWGWDSKMQIMPVHIITKAVAAHKADQMRDIRCLVK